MSRPPAEPEPEALGGDRTEQVAAAAAEWSIDTWIGSLDVVQLLARCLSAPLEHPSSLAAAAVTALQRCFTGCSAVGAE